MNKPLTITRTLVNGNNTHSIIFLDVKGPPRPHHVS
jgi:hypothetical protein